MLSVNECCCWPPFDKDAAHLVGAMIDLDLGSRRPGSVICAVVWNSSKIEHFSHSLRQFAPGFHELIGRSVFLDHHRHQFAK
ncbi:hypothetical protein [Couchioplanes caeruleus]|uniref:Uncharacterized protein n=1 Tax=Couchioplanes caeruleus subsp. caeruleus TaxID=56427 RepID=A0A1K0FIT3_9ACTN|nr:hypothetical protein [Couchioplanes caeruleus]OJF12767.1 hypothetical protein BG844_18735 [Couchioplanes caeruleus subsp. caeruleus]